MKQLILSLAGLAARFLPMPVKQTLYRSPRLAGWIRRGLNRAAPAGLTTITVAAGGLQGMRLTLDLQREKDYWLGTYEPGLQDAIRELVKPGDVVYDIGANIGYISLILAQAVGDKGKVFAFEALPENQVRLRENISLNNLDKRVSVVPVAVIDTAHSVRFLVGPSGGMGKAEGSAGRQEVVYSTSIMVAGTSLDEFVYGTGHPSPQIIKVDIEGGEVLALPGMQRVLSEARPLLLLELHGPEAARVAWDILVKAGYQICRMEPGFPGLLAVEELDWKSYLVGLPL
jgi:FkbM family methyltransferase